MQEVIAQASTALQVLVNVVGGGILVWGIIVLVQNQMSNDSTDSQKGIKQIAVGGVLAIIANTLIPVFMNWVSGQLIVPAP
jgi:predicted DNA repair protein MutK